MSQQFTSVIFKAGINPCVDVPQRVSLAFVQRGYIPVAGTIDGVPIQANLVPLGGGRHRLFINGDMRVRAKVDVGTRIKCILDIDFRPRPTPMPEAFALRLRASPTATVAWDVLPPSRRKEILRYLNSAKRRQTLMRNVDKAITMLSDKHSTQTLGGIALKRPPAGGH